MIAKVTLLVAWTLHPISHAFHACEREGQVNVFCREIATGDNFIIVRIYLVSIKPAVCGRRARSAGVRPRHFRRPRPLLGGNSIEKC